MLIKNEDSVSAKKLLDKIFVIALKSLKIILLFYIKWVISSALKVKRKVFFEKISQKIIRPIIKKFVSKSYKKESKNLNLATANKLNVYFRR